MVLAAVLSMLRYVSEIDDRDFVDRLHSYFTANVLIALSIIVSFKYVENYCWAQDTYYLPSQVAVAGMSSSEKREKKISYYQWVPFFLLAEAACFRFPSLVWKCLSECSGMRLREIMKLSSDPNNIKPEIKKSNIDSLTCHLQGALRFHQRLQKKQIRPHKFCRLFNLSYTASFVTFLYIFMKILYLLNVILQLLLMNKFLETSRYSWYGFGAVLDLINGTSWQQSGMFPRVSLCDFDVRVMGNFQQHTIQCVLVINLFNEKIFIFLWFWFLILLIFTLGSLLYWFSNAIFSYPNQRFIIRHLEMSDLPFDPTDDTNDVDRFLNSFLKRDGIFVVRMLILHSGVIFGTELIASLWRSYFGIEHKLRRTSSFPAGAIWPPSFGEHLLLDSEKVFGEENSLRQRKSANVSNCSKISFKGDSVEQVKRSTVPGALVRGETTTV